MTMMNSIIVHPSARYRPSLTVVSSSIQYCICTSVDRQNLCREEYCVHEKSVLMGKRWGASHSLLTMLATPVQLSTVPNWYLSFLNPVSVLQLVKEQKECHFALYVGTIYGILLLLFQDCERYQPVCPVSNKISLGIHKKKSFVQQNSQQCGNLYPSWTSWHCMTVLHQHSTTVPSCMNILDDESVFGKEGRQVTSTFLYRSDIHLPWQWHPPSMAGTPTNMTHSFCCRE